MKFGVTHKLFMLILMAAGLAVVSSALIMQWSFSRGFLKFVDTMEQSGTARLASKLEDNYRTEKNWQFLRRDPELWGQLVAASLPEATPPPGEKPLNSSPPGGSSDHHPPPLPPHITRQFDQRLFLLDADRKVLVSHGDAPIDTATTPLLYQGSIVGYLGLLPRTKISDAPQKRFLREQKMAFSLVAGVVVLLSALLSLLLARRLVRPLKELTQATHQLAAGSFSVRVSVESHDELGQLARDFNALALTLNQSEVTRRQWVADISHELRTPLAILRGEIEALQDGIRQPTSEKINSLHGEVMHLVRLVDDLYQLSLSDVGALTYRKAELDLTSVLKETVENFRPKFFSKNIALEAQYPESGAPFFGDSERLHQLFSNLLDNSIHYTDSGGQLQITLHVDSNSITIDFKDSAPNVPALELRHLFERLYRVESSRNRSTGGAGLGLAICKNIVVAHSGSITAQASSLGGLWIRIELPGVNS